MPGREQTDAELIHASIVAPASFAEIFDRHFARIHAYLQRRVGERADDLAADVFVVAFERRGSFDGERAEALPWLYGIASNLVRARHRRDQRDLMLVDRLASRIAPRPNDPQDRLAGADPNELEAMRQLVVQLSEDDLTTLILFAWEDQSYLQIAEALAIPVGTVRSRLHRIRREGRELLGPIQAMTAEPTNDPRI